MTTLDKPKPVRVPFDSLTLRAVVQELASSLIGGQVQEIRQPTTTELLLSIRSQGQNYTLLLSADAQFARVHLTTERKPNAPTPSSFCTALRRHLQNGRILGIRQRDFDRIFELEVESHTEEDKLVRFTMIAELMGKHSNLILVNSEGKVIEAAKRISHRINRFRETLPGKPYLPPPAQTGRISPFLPASELLPLLDDLAAETGTAEAFRTLLLTRFEGFSPFLADEILFRLNHHSQEPYPITALLDTLEKTLSRAARNLYDPVKIPLERGTKTRYAYALPPLHLATALQSCSDLNAALDEAYGTLTMLDSMASTTADQLRRMERMQRRLEKKKMDAERTLAEAARAGELQQQGELLLAHLWKMETGAKEVTVQDFYSPDQSERTLLLNPKLTPQENAQSYFRRAQKARDGQERAATTLATVEELLKRNLALHVEIQQSPSETAALAQAITHFQKRLQAEGILPADEDEAGTQSSGPDFKGHKIRRFLTPEGVEIYWGETATANDFLTTRVAGANDLWLHVRSSTGSHVVIRTQGKPEKVPQAVLYRAARIAALHSAQKHSSLVPVDYTLKKYVRKPRGAEPGSVEIQREKTLHVNPLEADDKG